MWDGDAFVLESKLDGAGLVRFFLEDYAPLPFVAPWNGNSYNTLTIYGQIRLMRAQFDLSNVGRRPGDKGSRDR